MAKHSDTADKPAGSADRLFEIVGRAYVPIKIKTTIMGPDPKTALDRANRILPRSPSKLSLVLLDSADYSRAHGFRFTEARPLTKP